MIQHGGENRRTSIVSHYIWITHCLREVFFTFFYAVFGIIKNDGRLFLINCEFHQPCNNFIIFARRIWTTCQHLWCNTDSLKRLLHITTKRRPFVWNQRVLIGHLLFKKKLLMLYNAVSAVKLNDRRHDNIKPVLLDTQNEEKHLPKAGLSLLNKNTVCDEKEHCTPEETVQIGTTRN